MRPTFSEVCVWLLLFLVVIGFGAMFAYAIVDQSRKNDRLMKQCMERHAEWQCEGILNRQSGATVVVPIYSGRR